MNGKQRRQRLLKNCMLKAKQQGHKILSSADIAERYNDSPQVRPNMELTATQVTYFLKQMVREDESVESVVLSKNGVNRHGNARVKLGLIVNDSATEDPDILQPTKVRKTISVIVGKQELDYLEKCKDEKNESPGAVFRRLIAEDLNR